MKNRILLIFCITNLLIGTLTAQQKDEIAITNIKANLEFLASDELEGREATSRGEKIASLFIASELQKIGFKPFGDSGSYFQKFNMDVLGINTNSQIKIVNKKGDATQFNIDADFLIDKRNLPDESFANKDVEVVFAGYGLTADELNYDDYKNLDVTGKVVLVLDGMPKVDNEEELNSQIRRNYGRWSSKITNAQNRGAVGLLIVPGDEMLANWDRFSGWMMSPSFRMHEEEKSISEKHIPAVLLNEKTIENLLDGEKHGYAALKECLTSNSIPGSFKIKKKVSFSYSTFREIREARNVIGFLEGSDDILKNEFVSIGAHYDHLGKSEEVIFNGADDNGSGTVGVLEAVRTISEARSNKRSIVAVFHTAEEKGLQGAKYATENSNFIKNTVVNINIDMVGRKSEDSIHCIGSDKLSAELYDIIESINKEKKYFYLDYRFNDPDDPNRYYYRSDHLYYANKNIPIVFFYDYMQEDYHKFTDTVEKINFKKIMKAARLAHDIALKIANLDHKLIVNKKDLAN
ncbi:MAG: M28 family peptidase [Bacteroidetes bacterium]|nr:M28 family peptidase [Bacteroidota bacterium]